MHSDSPNTQGDSYYQSTHFFARCTGPLTSQKTLEVLHSDRQHVGWSKDHLAIVERLCLEIWMCPQDGAAVNGCIPGFA